MYLNAAFHEVCKEVETPEVWYVCLIETCRCYGGPEEGGWWYDHRELVSYKQFNSKGSAEAAKKAVESYAEDLTKQASKQHSQYCRDSCDWAEDRGIDVETLPEIDGPNEFYLMVTQTLPVFSNERPRYE